MDIHLLIKHKGHSLSHNFSFFFLNFSLLWITTVRVKKKSISFQHQKTALAMAFPVFVCLFVIIIFCLFVINI